MVANMSRSKNACRMIMNFASNTQSLSRAVVCVYQKVFFSTVLYIFIHIFKNYFLFGRSLFYNVLLVSIMYQHELAVGIHMSPPIWTSLPPPTPSYPIPLWHPIVTEHHFEVPASHNKFPWPILHFNVLPYYSLNLAHPFLPPLCPKICSLRLLFHCCPANGFISTIFLDSIHMH